MENTEALSNLMLEGLLYDVFLVMVVNHFGPDCNFLTFARIATKFYIDTGSECMIFIARLIFFTQSEISILYSWTSNLLYFGLQPNTHRTNDSALTSTVLCV